MKDKKWWVIQIIKGVFNAYGPYRTYEGAHNRYERISGGEIHLHGSWEEEPEKVIQEFKLELVER